MSLTPFEQRPDDQTTNPVLKGWFDRIWRRFKADSQVAAKTAAFTPESEIAWFRIDASGGAIAVTVPLAASYPFRRIGFIKTDSGANAATLTRSGSDTINGATSFALGRQYQVVILKSNGIAAWDIENVAIFGSMTVTGLTAGRVVLVGTNGLLADDSGLTFDTTTNILTAGGFSGPLNGTVGATTPAAATVTTLNVDGAFVFNEAGGNVDARFEGDTDANLLFTDASTDHIGIGTSAPSDKLHVQETNDTVWSGSAADVGNGAFVRVVNLSDTAGSASGLLVANRASSAATGGIVYSLVGANDHDANYLVEGGDHIFCGATTATEHARITPTGTGILATPSSSTALIVPAGTTSKSSLRIPHGAAPTSPVNGDMWTTTSGLFVRINGATVGPLS